MAQPPNESSSVHDAVSQLAGSSRFIALFAILGSLFSALAVFVYAAAVVAVEIWHTVAAGTPSEEHLKSLTITLIETTDSFLFGTVLYIAAIGFFQLFVDPSASVPSWMRIENLDQLKAKLVGVVVVLLAVSFLGRVSEWQGGKDIAYLGVATGSVLIGLAYFGFRAHEH